MAKVKQGLMIQKLIQKIKSPRFNQPQLLGLNQVQNNKVKKLKMINGRKLQSE